MRYVRIGGLDVLPALAEVLPQLAQGTETQLPLELAGVPLLGRQDLPQRVDLLLHLQQRTQVKARPLAHGVATHRCFCCCLIIYIYQQYNIFLCQIWVCYFTI